MPLTLNPREVWRLVVPKEHGSWSLALEPVALGLLAAPTRAGGGLALAVVAGFFARRPLKLLLQNRPDERRSLAAFTLVGLLALIVLGLAYGFSSTGWRPWVSLLPVGLAGLAFVWFDVRGENRAGLAELTGAAAFAWLPATFAMLAGWSWPAALALTAIMLARSVPTVLMVRTLLRRAKGQSVWRWPALVANGAAVLLLAGLASGLKLPWLPVAVSALLFGRAIWYLMAPRPPFTARQLGILEMMLGFLVVLTGAVSWLR